MLRKHIAVEYRNFEFTSLSSDCYQIEIYQIWLMNFSIKEGLSLALFQFHLKEDNMLSLLTNGFTQKFPICFVFFKKWIGFCLINAYSVSHIFFLVKADFFADWIADSVVETEHLFTNIEVALRKQAREKLIISWWKRDKFKFLLLNGNV